MNLLQLRENVVRKARVPGEKTRSIKSREPPA